MIALLIKASLVIIVLLAFYKLFLEKESFFAANRLYLLSGLLFAGTLPFVVLPELVEHQGFLATLFEPSEDNESISSGKVILPAESFSNSRETAASKIAETAPKNTVMPREEISAFVQPGTPLAPQTSFDKITNKDEAAVMADNTVKVIVGKKDGEKIFIVDQNNNLDFRDDPVRLLKKINWTAMEGPISFQYRIYNGKAVVRDSSWVFIGLMRDDRVWVSAAQHLRSTFSIEDQDYTVGVFNDAPSARWCFEDPLISITAQNGIQKDSLRFGDKFGLGAFLQFGKSYYQFADVANDGRTLTLVREKDISDNIGTQVGLIAPDFSAVTTNGDSIALSDFHDRYLLLINLDMCSSPKETCGYYSEIWDRYHARMGVIGIESDSQDMQAKIDRFNLSGNFVISKDNPSIRESYRDFHCSKICFLIDPDGRIIDRFEIDDWAPSLAKHFE